MLLMPLDLGFVMGLVWVWPVLGLTIAFRLFNFPDLTIEGSLALGASVFALAVTSGASPIVGLAGAITAGAMLGALTAVIHTWLNLNKFLAGIIVVAISYTLSLRVMSGPNIGLLGAPTLLDGADELNAVAPGLQLGVIAFLGAALIAAIIALAWLLNSTWGLRLRTVGSNPDYGRALGLSEAWRLMGGLALTNGLAAIGGAVLASYQGFADVSLGQGGLILALASMSIGEQIAPERVLRISGFALCAAVLGAFAYQIISAYALFAGLAPTDLKLATAVFVLAIVALRLRRRDEVFSEALQ